MTNAGRLQVRNNCYTGGIDAHQARNWIVRDNNISGFWCGNGLSEHAIHFWVASRDTLIERNRMHDNARGVGLGLTATGSGRTYSDAPCPAAGSGFIDHYGGIVRNNFISTAAPALFASEFGFDCGICAWNACGAKLLHNSIFTADPAATFSALEWRFPNTSVEAVHNLVNDSLRQRDGGTAVLQGNLLQASAAWYVDAARGDLHLAGGGVASAAVDAVDAPAAVSDDVDAQPRPRGSRSDVGADEYGAGPDLSRRLWLPALIR
jgi:hypothetical protein